MMTTTSEQAKANGEPREIDPLSILFQVPRGEYGEDRYRTHLLEQYKLFIGTAEANSTRRQTANSFFLTVNTAALAFLGLVLDANDQPPLVWVLTVSAAGIALCYYWYRLVRSYRGLNSGKFRVIREIEKCLPLAVFDAEWEVVGCGKDPELYLPVTHVEQNVPWVFCLLYVALAVWHAAEAIGWV